MNTPQASFKIGFVREWHFRKPYLYRYLECEFVDRFFDDGTLRLSSFLSFSKHADEQRKDGSEGWGIVTHQNAEGEGQTMMALMRHGQDAYVVCGSTMFDPELSNAFSTDSGFRINDTTMFADAVAHHIPGFRHGIEGLCLYVARRSVSRDLGRIDLDALRDDQEPKNMSFEKMMSVFGAAAADDLFFLKSNRYAHQNEYRLLWFAHGNSEVHLDIKCPEARQFCTRFEDLWAERKAQVAQT